MIKRVRGTRQGKESREWNKEGKPLPGEEPLEKEGRPRA